MTINTDLDTQSIDIERLGLEMYNLIAELYPICRSITRVGVRKSLQIIQNHIPLEVHEVPTDTPVFNPAFDVTPAEYISAIVTEKGIVYPPYKENLKDLMKTGS